MNTVMEIKDIRDYIFLYLRKTPHKICYKCKTCIQWDPQHKKQLTHVFMDGQYKCYACVYEAPQTYNFFVQKQNYKTLIE